MEQRPERSSRLVLTSHWPGWGRALGGGGPTDRTRSIMAASGAPSTKEPSLPLAPQVGVAQAGKGDPPLVSHPTRRLRPPLLLTPGRLPLGLLAAPAGDFRSPDHPGRHPWTPTTHTRSVWSKEGGPDWLGGAGDRRVMRSPNVAGFSMMRLLHDGHIQDSELPFAHLGYELLRGPALMSPSSGTLP